MLAANDQLRLIQEPDAGTASNAERVRLIYRLVPRSSFLTAALVVMTALALHSRVVEGWLLLWFSVAIAILLARYTLYVLYQRAATTTSNPIFWENAFAAGALLMGMCWGALALFSPLAVELEFFLMVVIFTLTVSGARILAASLRSFACFCTPILLLQVWAMFFRSGTLFYASVAFLSIFVLTLLMVYAEFRRALLLSLASATEIDGLHRRQRHVFEAANVAMALTVDRRVVDCNEKFAGLFGYTREDVIGVSTRLFYRDDASWQAAGEIGLAAMLAGKTAQGELEQRHKSGLNLICESSVSCLIPGHPESGVIAVLHDVTPMRRQQTELRDALLRQSAIFDNAPAGIILTRNRVVEECNEFMATLLGTSVDALVGQTAERWFVSSERWAARGAEIYAAFVQGKSYVYEEEFVREDGQHFWCRVRGGMIDPDRPVDGPAVFVLVDVTERKLAGLALARSEQQMSLVLGASQSGIWDMDMTSRQIVFSQKFYSMLGFSPASAPDVLMPVLARVHRDDGERIQRVFYDHIRERKVIDEIFRLRRKDDSYLWVRGHGQAVWDEAGRATRFVGSISDMSEVMRHEEEIRQLALHDALTGLPNRRLLEDRLAQCLASARRNRSQFAVMLLDLDGFKAINDTHGHAAGDTVLLAVAERLRATMRASDTVARIGGDEFVMLIDGAIQETNVAALARKILGAISQPIEIDGGETAFVSGSIGIALFPDDADHAAQLLRLADAAMYSVKESARNGYRFNSGRHDAA